MHGEYLLLLAACFVITLPLEFILGARVHRRPRALLLALLPVLLVFGAWDLLGIHRGHWWYEASRISGVHLPGAIPLEEVLFFLVIPICALLTLEGVSRVLGLLRAWRAGELAREWREPGAVSGVFQGSRPTDAGAVRLPSERTGDA